jgi:biopolymer transport protein ExbD
MKGVVNTLFIDVFGLLIGALILILTLTSFYPEARLPAINLPKAEKRVEDMGLGQIKTLSISLQFKNGKYWYFYEDKLVNKEELFDMVKEHPLKSVVLRVEGDVFYKEVFSLVDVLRKAGIDKISFAYIEGGEN